MRVSSSLENEQLGLMYSLGHKGIENVRPSTTVDYNESLSLGVGLCRFSGWLGSKKNSLRALEREAISRRSLSLGLTKGWVIEEEQVGEPECRPQGVKAAKAASKKKKSGREEELSKLHGVLEMKEKLSRHKLLDRLLASKEPLSEMETSLKLKLMCSSMHVRRSHGCI
ncbi:hypothetical protein Bca52824_002135 [Brassica carinata]|uniref:Uncharacterized protein n=1 Tax=Brassica carinata TaxID=52824 RepID=A0A8X8BDJ3_BRACI|nr:hypothetical protein Bca52824_002135 [Brassica carinata]